MRFRKRPIEIDATRWQKIGDHPAVVAPMELIKFSFDIKCPHCGTQMGKHGRVFTLEGKVTVCPGDWIITGIKGEFYPCKPDIFEASYEAVEDTQTEENKND